MENPHLGRVLTAAATPFGPDGSVDHDTFRRLLRHLVATGSDGIVVNGTTGESPTTSTEEKLELLRTAVDEVGEHATIIAGTGTNATAGSVELTRLSCELGIDGVLVVTPYYNKPPREGLLRHFTTVARASSVPVMLYNVPARTGINLEPSLVAELARLEQVVAIKQANPDLDEAREIRRLAPGLDLYAGDDTSLLPMLGVGAVGVVGVASHLVGDAMHEVVDRWLAGDEAGAREVSARIEDVYETLGTCVNPIGIKAALEVVGIPVGAPRPPLVPATRLQLEQLRAMVQRHELEAAHV